MWIEHNIKIVLSSEGRRTETEIKEENLNLNSNQSLV